MARKKKKAKWMVACAFATLAVVSALPAALLSGGEKTEKVDPPASVVVVETAVLRQGSRGSEVKEVQRRLKQWGYYKGSVDGVFGTGTRSAVISFQKKNGLTADGVVGKATYCFPLWLF